MCKLNQRERNVLRKFVVFQDQLEQNCSGYWRWRRSEAGDAAVTVGNVIKALIDKGYLEYLNIVYPCIRVTKKAKALYCYRCSYGETYDNEGHKVGTCQHCDGKGMLDDAERVKAGE